VGLYRKLVIAVLLVPSAFILPALLLWRVLPLVGLVLVIPQPAGFDFLDGRRVMPWRDQLFELVRDGGLDLPLHPPAEISFPTDD
jgi:hypothetical protein